MALRLVIENETSLPDGGPLSVTVAGQHGIDIGRDQYLDWTLPDPSRCISGKHCEVRFHDGAYWLHDVSTNGTFVNGSDRRIQGPHRLRHGDRLDIGHYVIRVEIDGEEASAPPSGYRPGPTDPSELWTPEGEAAPPADPRAFQAQRSARPAGADPLDWFVDAPEPLSPAPFPSEPRRPAPEEDYSWAQAPAPRAPAAPPPTPAPRRPAPAEDASPWGTPSLSPAPPAPPAFPDPPTFDEPPALPGPVPEPVPAAEAGPLETRPPEPPPAPENPFRPSPAPERAPAAPPPAAPADPGEFVRRFAHGAGIPEEVFAGRDPGALAEQLGSLMRLVAEDVKQLLGARAETKRMVRSTNQTMVQALDNNPLKFAPTAADALKIMFGPRTSGYLDAPRALEQSFKDLKLHQVQTYAAMQQALRLLVADLSPEAIEEATDSDRGIASLLGSRKAKLWDVYAARWHARTDPHEDGIVDAFMLYFAEAYERGGGGR